MLPLPKQCPFCDDVPLVTELYCRACDTRMSGHFSMERVAAFEPEQLPVLQRLARLSPEQLRFVETFLRSEGKITRVEEELGISYPTVRARLNEVLQQLGFQPSEASSASPNRAEVLSQLEAGEITPDEALELLRQ